MTKPELKSAFAQFIQEHMPWPFFDVSRHDSEGSDAAHDIAARLLPFVEAEFADIINSAKASRRSRQVGARPPGGGA